MGKKNQMVALRFNRTSTLNEMAKTLRAQAAAVGAVPEKTFLDFTPHISVARIKNRSPEAQKQLNAFLTENVGALSNVDFNGFEIWTRPSTQVNGDLEYKKVR